MLLLLTIPPVRAADVFEVNDRLGVGINLGNMLDAPTEGAWGHVIEEDYFRIIAEAGFDSVRIPVRWSAHTDEDAPYLIDAEFMERVQWAVDAALEQGLAVVLNVHHYDAINTEPVAHQPRLLAIWEQIGERFAGYPETLAFEMLNEPREELAGAAWNEMVAEVLAVVREEHPTRAMIIGPSPWNGIGGLKDLELPEDDPHLMVTVHYYEPFKFTHQGAEWVAMDSDAWLGTTWSGTEEQRAAVDRGLDAVAAWAKDNGVPVYLGEYGAYAKADNASRVAWTQYVTQQARARGFSTAYWEFCAGFGAYDKENARWREDLLRALLEP